MARPKKLKVFRTPIGFHDAYVAAPSQKAALEAWGSDSNLFARGAAEQVTDPDLAREPLANPGKVIRRLRGNEADHLAALGDGKRGGKSSPASARRGEKKPDKPSRTALARAEERLEKLEREQADELSRLERDIEALERRRGDLLREQESDRDALAEERDRARDAYRRALRRWEKTR